ncbi:MAG: hydantoinase/oxoprolinase family protein [Hyphomicrobiaceae bacterium]|nr:hydantoinase/oxoprolinase family protein [Hyphomicrobiaceae bacterium]
MTLTAGLDVGGAHLKIALVQHGHPISVAQVLCPLWQGLDKLDAALAQAAPMLAGAQRFAVTMTGELSDLFDSRAHGVASLVDRLGGVLAAPVSFYMGPRGFGDPDQAKANARDVGSANFLATAAVVGHHCRQALLIDFGSTTADIIPVCDGQPAARGLTDAERQATGELVYTGLTRTAVMGVASHAPFRGLSVGLAREYLATMADVRRILGHDLDGIDLHATADGRGKSLPECTARLARMLGRDANDGTADDWQAAAAHIREVQLRSLHDAAALVATHARLPFRSPVVAVTAGIGAGEAAAVTRRLGLAATPFGMLIGLSGDVALAATHHAPAVAVALLAAEVS